MSVVQGVPHYPTLRSPELESLRRTKHVQAKLADGDIRGAVRLLGSESSFAPSSMDTLSSMRSKHPAAVAPTSFTPSGPIAQPPLTVNESAVSAAITSFPAGSSGGLDMLRPQHLKDLTGRSAGPAGGNLLSSITRLCNYMLAGSVPESVCPVLYGASLFALSKKEGDIRPIAIGNTWRRLTAKLGSVHISSRIGEMLQPVQLGFGTKGGLEAATHATRRFLHFPHECPKVLLKVDFSNAFNSVHRDVLLQTASTSLPELYPFLDQCYRHPSSLVLGEHIIASERGIQQGDPLGPALFSLITHPLASSLKTDLNIWYLDDGTIADDIDKVLHDFSVISEQSGELGLELNPRKCELFCTSEDPSFRQSVLSQFEELAPGIRLTHLDDGFQLGSPLSPQATVASLRDKTATLKLMAGRLQDLPTHCAFFLLKNTQAIPRITHILRCSSAWECTDNLTSFDTILRETLCTIMNVALSDEAWRQTSWPISKGGLGIRLVSELALPAFLSSYYGSLSLVERILPEYLTTPEDRMLAEGLTKWTSTTGLPPPKLESRHVQKEWDSPIVQNSINNSWEQASHPHTKARLLGVSASESGSFLQALPASSLGTLLSDNEFRIATALRLGAPLCQPHVCRCGHQISSHDTHGLSCHRNSGRLPRHTAVNALLQRAFVSAGFPATLEPPHLTTANNLRPDGVTLIPWSEGKSIAWDFTCGDSLAPSHLPFSSETALYVAKTAELHKTTKYSYLATSHHFTPIAVECLGGFGKESLSFIRTLGKKIATHSGEKRAVEYLLQRLSIAIQRGNAQAILGTLPYCVPLEYV